MLQKEYYLEYLYYTLVFLTKTKKDCFFNKLISFFLDLSEFLGIYYII